MAAAQPHVRAAIADLKAAVLNRADQRAEDDARAAALARDAEHDRLARLELTARKPTASKGSSCGCITKSWPAEGTASARKAAHNRGSRVSAASTGASPHTVSQAGVAAASRLLRFEARHATTAGNGAATIGGGIGPRSGLGAA